MFQGKGTPKNGSFFARYCTIGDATAVMMGCCPKGSVPLSSNVAAGKWSVGESEGINQGFQITWMGKRDGMGMGEGKCQFPPMANRG